MEQTRPRQRSTVRGCSAKHARSGVAPPSKALPQHRTTRSSKTAQVWRSLVATSRTGGSSANVTSPSRPSGTSAPRLPLRCRPEHRRAAPGRPRAGVADAAGERPVHISHPPGHRLGLPGSMTPAPDRSVAGERADLGPRTVERFDLVRTSTAPRSRPASAQATTPSSVTAQTCRSPTPTAVAPRRPGSSAGPRPAMSVPTPSGGANGIQHRTVPSRISAQTCARSTEISAAPSSMEDSSSNHSASTAPPRDFGFVRAAPSTETRRRATGHRRRPRRGQRRRRRRVSDCGRARRSFGWRRRSTSKARKRVTSAICVRSRGLRPHFRGVPRCPVEFDTCPSRDTSMKSPCGRYRGDICCCRPSEPKT